jgi:hypothetical protein
MIPTINPVSLLDLLMAFVNPGTNPDMAGSVHDSTPQFFPVASRAPRFPTNTSRAVRQTAS